MGRSTIAIPFHTSSSSLTLAIASVLRQTVSDIKVELIDDGAPSWFVDSLLAIGDPRVSVLSDGKNRGLAARLNESIRRCDSEFYFRMDADDLAFGHRVERMIAEFDRNEDLCVLGSGAVVVDEELSVKGLRGCATSIVREPDARRGSIYIHPTVVFRTEWLAGKSYDESLKRTEDKDFWIRYFSKTEFGIVPEPLLFYRSSSHQGRYVIRTTAKEERRLLKRAEAGMAPFVRSYLVEAAKLVGEGLGQTSVMDARRQVQIQGNAVADYLGELENIKSSARALGGR